MVHEKSYDSDSTILKLFVDFDGLLVGYDYWLAYHIDCLLNISDMYDNLNIKNKIQLIDVIHWNDIQSNQFILISSPKSLDITSLQYVSLL